VAYEWITDALDQTWRSYAKVLSSLTETDLNRPTPCPGWTVRDVTNHLIGFEIVTHGGSVPPYDGTYPSHVRNPIGELNEAFVADGRSRDLATLRQEFERVTKSSLARLRHLDTEVWEKVGWSPEGERPFYRFQETRVLDSWIHLQDIRDALLQPEDDHGPGEEIVVNRFESALPYIVGKRAELGEGHNVRINLVGRLARSVTLRVRDGRCEAVAATMDDPVVEITTPVALFWRRCAGRITADAFLEASATDCRGDRGLARRIAEGMAILI